MIVNPGLRRRSSLFRPTSISGLSGWWRQGDWISASERVSQWNDSSGNARHLLQAVGLNQPIELPWSGKNYYYVQTGTTGNRVTTPDNVAYDLTQFSAVFRLAFDNAASGATTRIGGGQMTSASSDLSWLFSVASTGIPQFSKTIDGTTGVTRAASAAVTTVAANYTFCWWMVTFDSTTGQVMFYYNTTDSNTVPTSWTQFGTVPATIATGIWTSGSAICLGAAGSSANTGTAYKMKRYALYSGLIQTNGTGGTLVLDNDFTAQSENATSWVASTGQTWTAIGAGARQSQIVGSKQVMADGTASFMRASYTQAQPVTRLALIEWPMWSSGGYTMDGVGASSAAIVATTSTPRRSQNAGTPTQNENSAGILQTYHAMAAVFSGASSSLKIDTTSVSGGNPGATTTGGLTIFADGGVPTGGTFGSGQVKEIIEYNRVLSSTEIISLQRYLSRLGNLGLAL